MAFTLPQYTPPDFGQPRLAAAPFRRFAPVEKCGVAPAGRHARSVFPEYFPVEELGQKEAGRGQ